MSELLTITTSQLDFLEMLSIRFAFNLAATFIIVVLLYARISKRKEFYFSYLCHQYRCVPACFFTRKCKN